MTVTASDAISAAISGNWKMAIEMNLELLGVNPNDIDALLRLARGYHETNQPRKANNIYDQVLELDPCNTIAMKYRGEKNYHKTGLSEHKTCHANAMDFIEINGKTQTIDATPLKPFSEIKKLIDCGDQMQINTSGIFTTLSTHKGITLARLPVKIGVRLKRLIKRGNQYRVFFKTYNDNQQIQVFIKEVFCSPENKGVKSFL